MRSSWSCFCPRKAIAEGLASYQEAAPDLVLLDVRLPDTDGFSVCRELRQKGREPILILSGRTDDVDKIVDLEVGADAFLAKPFHEAGFREVLSRCLRERPQHGPASPLARARHHL